MKIVLRRIITHASEGILKKKKKKKKRWYSNINVNAKKWMQHHDFQGGHASYSYL